MRARSYAVFERRYQPVEHGESILRDWQDIPSDTDEHLVWTVVDCDGRLYLTPGYTYVNYLGRVLCAKPWPEAEFSGPGYVY